MVHRRWVWREEIALFPFFEDFKRISPFCTVLPITILKPSSSDSQCIWELPYWCDSEIRGHSWAWMSPQWPSLSLGNISALSCPSSPSAPVSARWWATSSTWEWIAPGFSSHCPLLRTLEPSLCSTIFKCPFLAFLHAFPSIGPTLSGANNI